MCCLQPDSTSAKRWLQSECESETPSVCDSGFHREQFLPWLVSSGTCAGPDARSDPLELRTRIPEASDRGTEMSSQALAVPARALPRVVGAVPPTSKGFPGSSARARTTEGDHCSLECLTHFASR